LSFPYERRIGRKLRENIGMQLHEASAAKHNAAALPPIPLKFAGHSYSRSFGLIILTGTLLLAGCSKRPQRVSIPPVPAPTVAETPQAEPAAPPREERKAAPAETTQIATAKVPTIPVPQPPPALAPPSAYVEFGTASWYGEAFHNRSTANGELYDMNALTAAHRTLPFNTRVRVTNVSNGQSVEVRITDRGPFVPGRVIDLSYAAAKQLDMWRQGTARVKIESVASPAGSSSSGRWAVLIGAFTDSRSAAQVKGKLERRYRTANVRQYAGPTKQWWVRIRVLDDDKLRAEEIARDNQTPEGGIYLVRLD
jgi:rare lipoprotein A